MKSLCSILFFSFLAFSVNAQSVSTAYNQALADSLGADEYGMKPYVLVILKTGSSKLNDQNKVSELFRGHLNNIGKLAEEGKLVVAGPLGKNEKNYRGIFIFNTKTIEEAKDMLQTDPAIKEKLLDAELYEWYGSAALPMYLPAHTKIEKIRP
ncbi:YciI family protein [Pontibacter sp. MBLB2868]|uniref:YciI family protein n=1 Tax=Pontibacter sp. MBLB2868 TaxID=3451555 RepID=UPI003F7568D9